jgi:hypothetical protein
MTLGTVGLAQTNDVLFIGVVAGVIGFVMLGVIFGCFYWFRREHRRLQRKILQAIAQAGRGPDELFVSGKEAAGCGELVAQFRVNQGKQVVSVLEADGRRFIHVDGELSAPERARMVRYLKSEGFMS